jgi:DNA-binding SARP family transcriptional activator
MDFRLLGPLEVRSQGRALPLGGPKQRAVLAMLLLQPGEVVSTDRLIDELWGERPPKTVEAYIQNCIHRLRVVLGRDAIETRRPGYVLRADEDSIDAVEFERAVTAARALEPAERAAALREALGLWRGAPLADLAFEAFARGEIERLEELRVTALEERLEAELELGRHAEVLPELIALANRHPTRERLRYLQMLALYRSGRQRDALRAYQEARRELVEELGLEPGEDLRGLERRIIAQDPALGVGTVEEPERDPRRVAVLALELVEGAGLNGFDGIVEAHGGTVRELLSDEAIAVFAGHDDDVLRALRAAKEAREDLAGSRTVVDRVAAGDVDGVRTLLRAADPENIVIGADALALVPAAVDVVPHESGGFRVLRFDSEAEPFARRFDTPLVGREAELDWLRRRLETVAGTGASRRVVVVGDAGVGKTRLVREFVRWTRLRANVVVGRCVAYGEGTALVPVFQIVRRVGHLGTALVGEPDADRVAERLQNPSTFQRSEGFWAFRRLLESLATALPLVVVLEDMHWAAGTFLDLVDYLDGWTVGPVMLLCLGRLELLDRRPEWRDGALMLEPLSAEAARALATVLPEHAELDEAELERAVDAAEGNPLFLEQLLASRTTLGPGEVPPPVESLIASRIDALSPAERAALERASVAGRAFWRAAVEDATPPDERDDVGPALMSLVRKRLVHPERSVLAGEDGFRFHHALIRDVTLGGIPASARAEIHESVARSLDGRHGALDELVGHHLERAALLRHDPELAGEAGHRLGVAGMRALRRNDAAAATDLLERATALLGDDPSAIELRWGLGTAIKFSGDWLDANARLAAVAEEAARRGDRVIELRARVEQLWPKVARGGLRPEAASAFLENARAELEEAGDDIGLGRAWHLTSVVLGACEFRNGDAQRAAAAAARFYASCGFAAGHTIVLRANAFVRGPVPVHEAIEQCERIVADAETPVWTSFALPLLAAAEVMAARFDEAREHLQEARIGRAEFADRGTLATSWAMEAARVELLAGDPARAEEILAPSVEVLRTGDDASWIATNAAWLAEAQYRQGRYDEAFRWSDLALRVSPPAYCSALAPAGRTHAKALARLGRHDEARMLAAETAALLRTTDALDERAEVGAATAEVLALCGDHVGAGEAAAEAIALFEEKGNVVSAARVRDQEENRWGKPG